jgi:hypothetical protein
MATTTATASAAPEREGAGSREPVSPAEVTRERARALHRGMMLWRMKDSLQCPTFADLRAAGAISKDVPVIDGWGRDFRGYCGETSTLVRSNGPDGRVDTSDDIVEGVLEAP